MSEDKRTEIGEIGEFGLIDRLADDIKLTQGSTIKGVGDDAAIIKFDESKITLLSSDMLIEGIHFDLSYMPLQHLGYKAVTANVSDIAAMNGSPTQITVSLGLSNRFSVEAVESIYEGINAAADAYNLDVVGGDTTASGSGLIICISILGVASEGEVVRRSGAKNGDILCVTGDLGGAFMGLQILEREKQEFLANPEMQPKLDKYEYVVGRQLRPKARMDVIHDLKEKGIVPSSMIDISDGLASEIFHLCKESNLGTSIYEDKLPIDKETYETAAEFSIDPNTCALNGGEDYELLFTITQDEFEKIKNHEDIHTIGYMHEASKGKVMVTTSNQIIEIQAQGWTHFKEKE